MKGHFRLWTIVLFILSFSVVSYGNYFTFIRCDGWGSDKDIKTDRYCRVCLATRSDGNDRVCSKPYLSNSPDGEIVTDHLRDDFQHNLVKLKALPKEGFDLRRFYQRYSLDVCGSGPAEAEFLKKQIEYLQDKLNKLQSSMTAKKCEKKN